MHYKKNEKRSSRRSVRKPKKDWLVSHVMMDLALEAILRRVSVNRSYDIPYLAGYSKSRKIIYIDRHMPKSFVLRGRRIKTDRYLIMHEVVEKALIDKMGLPYQDAHQIALHAEQAAVRADQISWKDYDKFMQAYIKKIGDERLTRVPGGLDLKPYQDEHDYALLKKMKKVQK
jgi:hypothetical protein